MIGIEKSPEETQIVTEPLCLYLYVHEIRRGMKNDVIYAGKRRISVIRTCRKVWKLSYDSINSNNCEMKKKEEDIIIGVPGEGRINNRILELICRSSNGTFVLESWRADRDRKRRR